ncbi:hypothetical protein GWI33_004237 [Rhynchophorus ferrugineus]|uniref:Uncharacterized protein n=1 Tax=Rhynchophorus ferrugineus TaxID=354439 RepID=A0A834IXG0_RHYFE|nr:hypothetical protein GWI33_004237 [Rhynchophorus ferrugineus]
MNRCILFGLVFCIVAVVLSSAAPNPFQLFGNGSGHAEGEGSFHLNFSGLGGGSGGSTGSGLVKRDLTNHESIPHHAHTAACAGGRAPPPPSNTTSG